jgi:hypothetical protein
MVTACCNDGGLCTLQSPLVCSLGLTSTPGSALRFQSQQQNRKFSHEKKAPKKIVFLNNARYSFSRIESTVLAAEKHFL